jgi:hypothetical protein
MLEKYRRWAATLTSAVVLAFASTSVAAYSVPKVEIHEMVRESDTLVVAKITRGEVVRTPDGRLCGWKYTAEVSESFKGTASGQSIEFENAPGMELGGNYVLFLRDRARGEWPPGPRRRIRVASDVATAADCAPLAAPRAVLFGGHGALLIQPFPEVANVKAVIIHSSYIGIPPGERLTPASSRFAAGQDVPLWFPESDMLRLLRMLVREQYTE